MPAENHLDVAGAGLLDDGHLSAKRLSFGWDDAANPGANVPGIANDRRSFDKIQICRA